MNYLLDTNVGNCHLVTRNEHDFQDTGVTIFNPWKEVN